MSHQQRALLPAPPGLHRYTAEPAKAKTRRIPSCEPCRASKKRCDGAKPKCSTCVVGGVDCRYGDTDARSFKLKYQRLKEKRTAQEELYTMLQTMSELDAAKIFRRIRSGETPDAIVRYVKEGNMLLELLVVPSKSTRFEFPYAAHIPSKVLGSIYFRSHVFEAIQTADRPPLDTGFNAIARQSNYAMPLFAAEMADPLLAQAKPSNWTRVSSNDPLLRKLLEAYFMYEYPWEYIFHKDYFLEDMISGDNRFCSSLLVNAVLAKACTCSRTLPNRSKFWIPETLTYRFLAEAKRLWELEEGELKLTTVHAGCLINAAMNMCGHDRPGIIFSMKSLIMAEKLGIFHAFSTNDQKLDDARAFTAWGISTFLTLQSYYFFQPPYISGPPPHPLPSVETNPEWYSEIWLRYPPNEMRYPMGFGHNMKALSCLRMIMRDICAFSFSFDQPPRPMPWEQALAFYARLQNWFEALPAVISHQALLYPAHIKLHCEYYSTIIMLFDAQLSQADSDHSTINHYQRSIAQDITAQATIQLESLLRIYYLRHGFETFDALLLTHLVHLSNVVLTRLAHIVQNPAYPGSSAEDIEWLRSTLILCLKGLHDQSKNFHMSGVVLSVLKKRLSAEYQDLVGRFVTMKDPDVDQEELDRVEPVVSDYVIPIVNLNEDPGAGRIVNIL